MDIHDEESNIRDTELTVLEIGILPNLQRIVTGPFESIDLIQRPGDASPDSLVVTPDTEDTESLLAQMKDIHENFNTKQIYLVLKKRPEEKVRLRATEYKWTLSCDGKDSFKEFVSRVKGRARNGGSVQ